MADAVWVIGFLLRHFVAGALWAALCLLVAGVLWAAWRRRDTRSAYVREIDAIRKERGLS